MSEPSAPEPCPICAKHRGDGPLLGSEVWRNELVVIGHRAVHGASFAGYLFVETLRHVPYLDALNPAEVTAVADAVWRASAALRAELDPGFVFSAIIGTGVAHFHQHVFVRHRGTPADIPWDASPDWPDAPHLSEPELVNLCNRLRTHFP